MQKIIKDTIKEFRKEFPAIFTKVTGKEYLSFSHNGQVLTNIYEKEAGFSIQDFLKQALTKAYEAGQKSREKEIVELIKAEHKLRKNKTII
jgi:hypothetical protein